MEEPEISFYLLTNWIFTKNGGYDRLSQQPYKQHNQPSELATLNITVNLL